MCSYAPYVLMSIFAKALTDRFDKKKTMLVCDVLAVFRQDSEKPRRKERECTCSCKRGNWIFKRQSNDYDIDIIYVRC